MSQLNVDTLGAQTGTTISMASGHTLSGTGSLKEADIWYLTADSSSSADPISSNLSRLSVGQVGKLGTGMSVSSGIWTFPSTGLWYIQFNAVFYAANGGSGGRGLIAFETTDDNFSSETAVAQLRVYKDTNGQNITSTASQSIIMDVTNTSNDKIKFKQETTGTATLYGDVSGGEALTNIVFIRLGDT
tara:strand:- start:160 stop:723 length:564 start_codon:yes stop_codon:yes gene_type:complete